MSQDATSIASQYDPAAIEREIYEGWEQGGAYDSTPREGRKGYCILLPPPNVTGSLHMGHAFQHVVMDALIRHRRMWGDDVLWQPGTDHAGVGTHIVVSRALRGQGLDPDAMSREEFLEKVLEWKDGSASTIGRQMRSIGDSCDWSRNRFTLDPALSEVVRDVFIRLHDDGLIYRGKRLVNWDPRLLTALADLEVVSEEEAGVLYHVRYPYVDGKEGEGMIIATTRPETILVDGALAVAPGDLRYAKDVGRFVHVPGTKRTIEIIEDEHVDPDFGSGCVKITAAHDFNDYEVAMRHPDKNIPIIELMTPEACLNDNAPVRYRGLDRYAARERIVADLDAQGLLVKKEDHRYMLPRGERSGVVVEPMLSDQWFVRTEPLAELALKSVREERLRFVPRVWRSVYENWLSDVKDWCISRQIDWGHRIPAWEDEQGNCYVAKDQAQAQAKAGDARQLRQVDDVLDTWFSSALWPLSTLGWPDTNNAHFKRYFPTSTLVTGNDIIFFWVARMVMMSEYLVGREPFAEVYMHGLVRDKNGEKMSKSRGNVLDPMDLINGIGLDELLAKRVSADLDDNLAKEIERNTRKEFPDGIPKFGSDALRLTFASLAGHGRNINFDLGRIDGHRRYCTKLWQASRFVIAACADSDGVSGNGEKGFAERWMASRLQRTERAIAGHVADYRFDLVVERLTLLFRDEFCDWYIEVAKERLAQGGEIAAGARHTLAAVLAAILRLAHPVIPFITAELWKSVGPLAGFSESDIITAPYPAFDEDKLDVKAEEQMAEFIEIVHASRSLRASLGIDPGKRLSARLQDDEGTLSGVVGMLKRLARLGEVEVTDDISSVSGEPVVEAARCRLQLLLGEEGAGWQDRLEGEITRLEESLARLGAKLGNDAFVTRAPAEVVDEARRRRDGEKRRLDAARELVRANTA